MESVINVYRHYGNLDPLEGPGTESGLYLSTTLNPAAKIEYETECVFGKLWTAVVVTEYKASLVPRMSSSRIHLI